MDTSYMHTSPQRSTKRIECLEALDVKELFMDPEVCSTTRVILEIFWEHVQLVLKMTCFFPSTKLPAERPWHFTSLADPSHHHIFKLWDDDGTFDIPAKSDYNTYGKSWKEYKGSEEVLIEDVGQSAQSQDISRDSKGNDLWAAKDMTAWLCAWIW